MKRALAALPLAILTVAFVPDAAPEPTGFQDPDPAVQDPPDEEEETEELEDELERDIFGRLRTKQTSARTGLEGMRQLLAMELEGYPPEGLMGSGYLLISDSFLSFEMHAYYDANILLEEAIEDGYQSFMAEYELIAGDQLKCETLIGSYIDEEDNMFDFESAGMVREFELERQGDLLTLRWGDGDWMTFGRRLSRIERMKDVYGRDRGERTLRGPDIFGREGVKRPGEGDDPPDDEDDG